MKLRLLAVLLAVVIAQPADAGRFEWSQVDWTIGAGAVSRPDYEGSDSHEARPWIYFRAERNNEFIEFEKTMLRINMNASPNWHVGPVFNFRDERDDVSDAAVKAMRKIDLAVEIGGFLAYESKSWRAMFLGAQDVVNAHDGYILEISGAYKMTLGPKLTGSIGPFTTYASGNYMQTYFGVSASDSVASGLPQFNASRGFKDVGAALFLRYRLVGGLGLRLAAIYFRLLSDAEDSPVVKTVGSQNQFFGGAQLTYTF